MMERIIDMHHIEYNKKEHIRIDRQSVWGNPFTLKNSNDDEERTEVLWKYTLYLLRNQKLLNTVHKLEGKTLACWCYPKRKCHGQILVYLVNHPDIIATTLVQIEKLLQKKYLKD